VFDCGEDCGVCGCGGVDEGFGVRGGIEECGGMSLERLGVCWGVDGDFVGVRIVFFISVITGFWEDLVVKR